MEASNDGGMTWTTVGGPYSVSWSSSGETKTFSVPAAPPGPGPAYPYWRIHCTAAGGSVLSIAEMEMYDAAGTLLTTGGTASASSAFDSSSIPSYAFDANFSNFWSSSANPSVSVPQWLAYQFASPVVVKVVRIAPRTLGSQYPQTFKIQYSDDGIIWADATASISPPASGWPPNYRGLAFAISPGAGTYPNWRMRITATQDGNSPSFSELQFRETAGGADATHAGVSTWAFGYENPGSNTGYEAFDNDATTDYFTTAGMPAWVGFALKRSVAITEVSCLARDDGSFPRAPTVFTMQGSYDGATWTDVWSGTFSTWTLGATQTAGAPVTAGALLIHPGMTGRMQEMIGGLRG
jgi:hypothetical protein